MSCDYRDMSVNSDDRGTGTGNLVVSLITGNKGTVNPLTPSVATGVKVLGTFDSTLAKS